MILIQDAESLQSAERKIKQASWVALDTEADSLHHYLEKLCLLQVSTHDEDYVIDPLALPDLKEILLSLETKPLLLHGADFDIRILKRFYGFSPKKIFDTMLAAQVLGYEKQGLADLAFRHCQVLLPKDSQKADWSRRPLSEKLLEYAANDTHYLKSIAEKMEAELVALGRLDWHQQNCEKLLKNLSEKKEEKNTQDAWQVKGWKLLRGKALNALKTLWEWRESEARRLDRPTFKVLHSQTLVDIARWSCENPGKDVAFFPLAPRNVKGELKDVLNRLLSQANSEPPLRLESKSASPKKKWADDFDEKMEAFKKKRDELGIEYKIHPSLFATNAMLEAILSREIKDWESLRNSGILLPWQSEVFGKAIAGLLSA